MDRMILPLFGALFLLLLGAAGAAAYYTHPPVHWRYRVLGMPVVGFDLPDSLLTQRDQARAGEAAAVRQLATLREASALRQAQVAPLPREARVAQARAVVVRERIMAAPPQDDACRFARAIDAIFLETLVR